MSRARRIFSVVATVAASAAILGAVEFVTRGATVHAGAIELLSPKWLRLLALLPYLWLVKGASLADFSWPQQALSVGARALLVAALAIALARPSRVDERRAVCTVALVDVSDSVSDRQLDDARAYLSQLRAEQAKHADDTLHLVTFAGRPHLVPLPPPSQPLPPDALARPTARGEKGDASDLQAALQLAYGLYPPGTLERAVLLTDGNQTQGDLLAEAAVADRHGVRLFARPFAAEHDDEVLVRELRVPPGVRLGAPFTVTADVYASRAVDATVTLYQDDFVNPLDGRKRLRLEAGRNVVSFKSEVRDPGFVSYRVQVALPADFHDRFPRNNQAVSSVAVKGRPRVLYVEGEPQASSYLTQALTRENFDVDTRGPYGLPGSLKDLLKYDLVIVSDVPASYLGLNQMQALESYVRDAGGGFVMAGGENSFGAGGWQNSPVEKANMRVARLSMVRTAISSRYGRSFLK